jgi:hypothetical protein
MLSAKFLNAVILPAVFFLSSCKKDEIPQDRSAPGDAVLSQYLFNSVRDEVDQQINRQAPLNGIQQQDSGDRSGCATVSIAPAGNVFPKTVIITFPDGCTTLAGAQIKGTIQLTISGRVRETGTTASFKLNNFEYKNHRISGDYTITFTDAFTHRTEVNNGTVITPDGRNIQFNSVSVATQMEGRETTFRTNPLTFLLDDAYQVTTTSWGRNSRGNEFLINPVTPLEYRILCQWITKGIITIQEGANIGFIATLDYGDGTCDNKATLTIGNTVREIRLP